MGKLEGEHGAPNTTDDNARIFTQWRARNGLTLAATALALEITPRTMSAYGTGAGPVPRYVALACKGWELEHHLQITRAVSAGMVGGWHVGGRYSGRLPGPRS